MLNTATPHPAVMRWAQYPGTAGVSLAGKATILSDASTLRSRFDAASQSRNGFQTSSAWRWLKPWNTIEISSLFPDPNVICSPFGRPFLPRSC
jgi:hypothetical protein